MSKNTKASAVRTRSTPTKEDAAKVKPVSTLPKVKVLLAKHSDRHRIALQSDGRDYVDEFNPHRAAERNKFIKAGAQHLELNLDAAALADLILREVSRHEEQEIVFDADDAEGTTLKQRLLNETPAEVKEDALRFLNSKGMIAELLQDFRDLGIVGEGLLSLSAYVIGTSRLLDKPLGGIVQAASSSGKSYVTNAAVDMMPPEAVLRATDISPQALYYLPSGSLEHKLVYVAERKHSDASKDVASANNTLAFRELMSNGELTKFVTDSGSEGLTTRIVKQSGPIAYLETTTQEAILEEDQNRMLQLQTDESAEQTERVIDCLARSAVEGGRDPALRDRILRKHHTAQRLLASVRVKIPFATLLTIPKEKVAARRAFSQLLTTIQAVALLRQFRHKGCETGEITATLRDYAVAYKVMAPVLRRSFSPVSDRAIDLFDIIEERLETDDKAGYGRAEFTRADCVAWSGLSMTEVSNRIRVLEEYGAVKRVEVIGASRAYRYKLDHEQHLAVKLSGLPTPEVLKQKIDAARMRVKQRRARCGSTTARSA